MQPPYGYPPQPPPSGYYPPQPPPPQRPTGWEGSKTLVALIGGCAVIVGIAVIGPFVGCAVCMGVGAATREQPAKKPPPVRR